jgi:hypothetical protein
MAIKNPVELKHAIEIAKTLARDTKEYFDIIWDIHKYKWYNWYQNLHIKADSPEDIENTEIFNVLKENDPIIHEDVENNIKYEIDKLNIED